MFEIILELLLSASVFMNVFSQTRLYDIQHELYIGKFASIMLLGAFLFLIIIVQRIKLRIPFSVKFISLTFSIWILFISFSFFNSSYPISGILLTISYIFLFLLSFYLMPNNLNKDTYLRYNKIFWGSIIVTLILSVILAIRDPASFYIVGDRIRYQSFFQNPNYLGMLSLLGILSSIQVYALRPQRRYLIPVLPTLFLLYLSDSRASMLASGVAALVMAYLSLLGRSNPRTKMMLLASTFTVLGSLIVLGCIAAYLIPVETLNKITSLRPLYWYQAMVSLEGIQWFFGQGIGNAGLGSLSFDNFYVNTLVQTGLFGLSAFVVFIMSVLYGLWRQLKQTPDDIALQVSIASFMALVIYSLFESAFFSLGNILSIYIWMNIGYQVAKNRRTIDMPQKLAA